MSQNRAYFRERYEELKARGRCVDCAQKPAPNGVRCQGCARSNSAQTMAWRRKKRMEELQRLMGKVKRLEGLTKLSNQ